MLVDLPIKLITLEDNSYHILIKALVEQVEGWLIIDTGASRSVFDKTFVEPFVQDMEPVNDPNSSGINAMIAETYIGTIPSLAIEGFQLKDQSVVIMDLSHVNQLYKKHVDMEIAGLIGSDFLVKYEAIIDYAQKRLCLNH